MKKLELNVSGMECAGCENRIKNTLMSNPLVKEVNASHESGIVQVTFQKEVSEEVKTSIIESIENLDFQVEK